MMRILLFTVSFIFLTGCQKDSPGPSMCEGYTRSEYVSNERASVVKLQNTVGQQPSGYVLFPLSEAFRSYMVFWAPCNLPEQFQKNTLSVIVSGYKLTRPGPQPSLTEQPFEITDIQLRR